MVKQASPRGLPPRIYVPIAAVFALLFLGVMAYLVADGLGVTGSVFGKSGSATAANPAQQAQGAQNSVQGGGPPPAVMAQLQTLRARIAKDPKDDVALTQLGDMYLAASKFQQAVPFYERALKANPSNVAAQTGLQQAKSGIADQAAANQ